MKTDELSAQQIRKLLENLTFCYAPDGYFRLTKLRLENVVEINDSFINLESLSFIMCKYIRL